MFLRNKLALSFKLSALLLTAALISAPKVYAEDPAKPAAAAPSEKDPSVQGQSSGVASSEDQGLKETAEEPGAPAASTSPSKEPVVVNGDKVEYLQEQKKVVGSGNVSIEYKGVTLTCRKVTVFIDTREALAEGNVKVKQKDGAYFTGEMIRYNFETQTGSVVNGSVGAKPFYGKASEVAKISDKQVNLKKGYITTCDLEHPHYRIESKLVRIYMGDKVIAHNIIFYVGNMPVFYLPYYIQPLRDTKKMNVTVIAGKGKDWGYYVLTATRFQLSDNLRGDLLLDYRTKMGPGVGVNTYYDTKQVGTGAAKFYYADQNDWLTADRSPDEPVRQRYRVQVRHRWDMPKGTDTNVIVEFNKLSDVDVIKDFFYKEYDELQTPENFNYISVLTSKPEYTTELLIRKRFDKFYDVVERLPEYKIDIKNFRVFKNAPIYYSAHASGAYLNHTYASQVPSVKDQGSGRVDVYNQLAYAGRLFKFWNITPRAGAEQTYYSRSVWGDTNIVRNIFSAGIDNSTKFYKIYNYNTDFAGLDINKIRHIITPSANYYFQYNPSIDPANLMQFDEIDAQTALNGINFAIENKLQTKRMGSDGQLKSVDLVDLIISTDYAFRLEKQSLQLKSNKFRSVNFQLEMIPYPWLYTSSKMMVNTKKYMVETASFDIVGNGGDKWSVGAGYRYENSSSESFSNLLTSAIMYKFNEVWRARVYSQLDLEDLAFPEWETTIYRDLHCWIAEFTYGVRNNNDQTLWFVMRLKAFPDYPIGMRRTYSRPRYGNEGN
jgi:LPS-assembly protein